MTGTNFPHQNGVTTDDGPTDSTNPTDPTNPPDPYGTADASDAVRPAAAALLDNAFAVLSVARRRYLLYYLTNLSSRETTFERATRAIYSYEAAQASQRPVEHRQSIRLSLEHNHLPRLAATGMLVYDPRTGVIRFDGDQEVEHWLSLATPLELD